MSKLKPQEIKETKSCPVSPDCPFIATLPAPSKSLDLHEVIILWSVPRRVCSDRNVEGCVVNSLLVLLWQLRMPDILESPPQIWFHFHEFNETLFSLLTQVMP